MQRIQDKNELYENIRKAMEGILEGASVPFESALVSLIALLKENFLKNSWVGFYRESSGHLWVGPYQGKLACIHLKPGQGVCGRAFADQAPVLVEDVSSFEGHVYCDPLARSEIVLPVWHQGLLVGVLDLDSHEPSAYDGVDQKKITELLKAIEPLPARVIL